MEEPKFLFKWIALQPARDFLSSLPWEVRRKVYYNIDKVAGGILDANLFKKLRNTDIWEFRTLYSGLCYRLFAFWDKEEEKLVVATHGLVKKSRKTPAKEIAKAEAIRTAYFNDKKQ